MMMTRSVKCGVSEVVFLFAILLICQNSIFDNSKFLFKVFSSLTVLVFPEIPDAREGMCT